ncbi:MAG: KR domain-containing protein [Desulfamplus sp.]|nr:KR domain-containing protein [Desulfamplus sp.]
MNADNTKSTSLSPVKQALIALKTLQKRYDELKAKNAEPIAVIGIGCRFPGGADSLESYWNLLKNGRDAIVEVPQDRWNIKSFYDSNPDAPGKMYCREGGFIGRVDGFDSRFFGISPREASRMDPQQRLVLEVAWESLENARISPSTLHGSLTGVFMGVTSYDYGLLLFGEGDPTRVDAYTGTGGTLGATAGRLSYILGLTGPSFALDTACSSSLVSVHLACQSLRLRECDLALAGGVNLMLKPEATINFCKARMLASDARCKTFDAAADGYVRGEGCGILVLKRLSDVDWQKDSVLAVIKGSAVNQDGPSGGFTIPSGPAQQVVIRKALESASLTPDQIDYIEAHGTGTALGDPIEVHALDAVFGSSNSRSTPLHIGSVKTNFGHLEAAAGMASLIKVILSLNHNQIPPHLHFKNPNPRIEWEQMSLKVNTTLSGWTKDSGVRLAGVSAFGFSGTNAHIILGDAPRPPESIKSENIQVSQSQQENRKEILCLSAKSENALRSLASLWADLFLKIENEKNDITTKKDVISSICKSANAGRSHFPYRLAVIIDIDSVNSRDARPCVSTSEILKSFQQDQTLQNISSSDTLFYANLSEPIGENFNLNEDFRPQSRHLVIQSIAKAYIQGYTIDWDFIYSDTEIFKGNLPTYPFERKRCWLNLETNRNLQTQNIDSITSKKRESLQSEKIEKKDGKGGLSPVKQALVAIKSLKERYDSLKAQQTEPIAVIGMGCRFPGGANTPEKYWELLKNGQDAIVEVPPYRWNIDACFDPNPDAIGKMYCRYGGFLGRVDGFDSLFFGLSPREVARMDPQHRLILEVAWEALEHSMIPPSKLYGEPVGVFLGSTSFDYGALLFGEGDLTRVDAFSGTGGTPGPAAGRLSYLLGFTGPSFVLDTACSSSLVAVHLACQSLRNKECSLAISGGVNLTLSPAGTVNFCKARMLAPDGRCKTFDSSANGYVRGEGCGIVVLKRLSDVAPQDRVLALLRGSAVNQDGPSGGFTVPSGPAQEKVIRSALEAAKVKPEQIDYIEAHGTGTSLGDPIEVEALGGVFADSRNSSNPLLIGSVKTNFGHLEAAAGMASLIKVILSLNHGQIPPHLHFKEPNPRIQWDMLPIKVNSGLNEWSRKQEGRFAGISCFGFSGTNAHLVVGEASLKEPLSDKYLKKRSEEYSKEVLCLSAKSERALQLLAGRWADFLTVSANKIENSENVRNSDDSGNLRKNISALCKIANAGRSHFSHRLTVEAKSASDMTWLLNQFAQQVLPEILMQSAGTLTYKQVRQPSKITFVFKGGTLPISFKDFDKTFDKKSKSLSAFYNAVAECRDILANLLPKKTLEEMPKTASFILEYALAKQWIDFGLKPDEIIFNEAGEVAASTVAGIFSLADGVVLSVANIQSKEQYQTLLSSIEQKPQLVRMVKKDDVDKLKSNELKLDIGLEGNFGDLDSEPLLAFITFLAKAYLKGISVNWDKVYADVETDSILSLSSLKSAPPFYPFEHTRCWIEEPEKIVRTEKTAEKSKLYPIHLNAHPLLGVCLELPMLDQIRFQSILNPDNPPHLKDHRLFGRAVVPAADYLVLLLTASQNIPLRSDSGLIGNSGLNFNSGSNSFTIIKDILFAQAMFLENANGEAENRAAQLVLEPKISNPDYREFSAKVLSSNINNSKDNSNTNDNSKINENINNEWQTHCRGKIGLIKSSSSSNKSESDTKLSHFLENILNDFTTIQARCPVMINGADFYAELAKSGYNWGESFSWLKTIWKSDREAIFNMRLPELPDNLDDYPVYPGLLDAGFQVLGSFGKDNYDSKSSAFMPFSISNLEFNRKINAAEAWGYVSLIDAPSPNKESFKGDICWFDKNGIAIKVSGFEFRRIKTDSDIQIQKFLYQPVWRDKYLNINKLGTQTLSGIWLILSDIPDKDTQSLGSILAQKIEVYGGQSIIVFPKIGEEFRKDLSRTDSYYLDPTKPEDFQKILQVVDDTAKKSNSNISGIIHLWSLNHQFPLPQSILDAQERRSINELDVKNKISINEIIKTQDEGVVSILHLIQAEIAQYAKLLPMWFITRNSQPVVENMPLSGVLQSPVWGLAMTLSLEHSSRKNLDQSCRCVDLISADSISKSSLNIEAGLILKEIENMGEDRQIAVGENGRFVKRLTRLDRYLNSSPVQIRNNIGSRDDDVYLITGGLGALGVLTAQHLISLGAKHIVLMSRQTKKDSIKSQIQKESGKPQINSVETLAVETLIEQGVEVQIRSGDVTDIDALEKIFTDIEERRLRIAGIVHAAGTIDDGILINQSRERFQALLSPKIIGAINLYICLNKASSSKFNDNKAGISDKFEQPDRSLSEYSRLKQLDFIIFFSSIAAVTGSPAQGSYAAANAFLDSFAHQLRSEGLPALSINYGPWKESGMAANKDLTVSERWRSAGIEPLPPSVNLSLLGVDLNSIPAQVGMFSVDWSRFLARAGDGGDALFLSELVLSSELILSNDKECKPDEKILSQLKAVDDYQDFSRQSSSIIANLRRSPAMQRANLVSNIICQRIAVILDLSPNVCIDPDQSLFDYGLNSLMAIELKEQLERDLDYNLPATFAFDFPTVRGMCECLLATVEPVLNQENNDNQDQNSLEHSKTEVINNRDRDENKAAVLPNKPVNIVSSQDSNELLSEIASMEQADLEAAIDDELLKLFVIQ